MLRRLDTPTLLLANSLIVTFLVLFKVSWGFSAPGILDSFYEVQARSLGLGHAYLVPGPPDVYYHDSSMFQGRAYLYFGPLPSILLLVCNTLFGRLWAHYITTSLFIFIFVYACQRVIATLLEAALATETGHSSFRPGSSLGLLWCFLFIPPFPASPVCFFGPNFYIYDQQTLFALGLGIVGVLALLRIPEGQATYQTAKAGFAFALASTVKATWLILAFAVLGFSFVLLVARILRYGRKAIFAGEIAWLTGGVLCLFCLFIWNCIRFNSLGEFGVYCIQNCAHVMAFRAATGFFSWKAKLANVFINLLTYYTNANIVAATGLAKISFTVNFFRGRGFFDVNPQWIFVLAVMPLSCYRVLTTKREILPVFVTILLVTVYMHAILTGVPPGNHSRYFIEFYFFLILTLFLGLLGALPPRAGILCMVALLSLHLLPGRAYVGFFSFPNLRILREGPLAFPRIDTRFCREDLDISLVDGAVWPRGTVAIEDTSLLVPYNAMGIYPMKAGWFGALDVAAIYIIPEHATGKSGSINQVSVQINDVQASSAPGTVSIFVERYLVGSLRIYPDRDVDAIFTVPMVLEDNRPYQLMMIFLPNAEKLLPPRPLALPWKFRSLSLTGAFHGNGYSPAP